MPAIQLGVVEEDGVRTLYTVRMEVLDGSLWIGVDTDSYFTKTDTHVHDTTAYYAECFTPMLDQ